MLTTGFKMDQQTDSLPHPDIFTSGLRNKVPVITSNKNEASNQDETNEWEPLPPPDYFNDFDYYDDIDIERDQPMNMLRIRTELITSEGCNERAPIAVAALDKLVRSSPASLGALAQDPAFKGSQTVDSMAVHLLKHLRERPSRGLRNNGFRTYQEDKAKGIIQHPEHRPHVPSLLAQQHQTHGTPPSASRSFVGKIKPTYFRKEIIGAKVSQAALRVHRSAVTKAARRQHPGLKKRVWKECVKHIDAERAMLEELANLEDDFFDDSALDEDTDMEDVELSASELDTTPKHCSHPSNETEDLPCITPDVDQDTITESTSTLARSIATPDAVETSFSRETPASVETDETAESCVGTTTSVISTGKEAENGANDSYTESRSVRRCIYPCTVLDDESSPALAVGNERPVVPIEQEALAPLVLTNVQSPDEVVEEIRGSKLAAHKDPESQPTISRGATMSKGSGRQTKRPNRSTPSENCKSNPTGVKKSRARPRTRSQTKVLGAQDKLLEGF